MADHLSPIVRPAFPSSAIISERSSPSRVRFAAPNNGAPLTAPGRSGQQLLRRGKGSLRTAPLAGDHFAAILVPFFAARLLELPAWRLGPWGCRSAFCGVRQFERRYGAFVVQSPRRRQ